MVTYFCCNPTALQSLSIFLRSTIYLTFPCSFNHFANLTVMIYLFKFIVVSASRTCVFFPTIYSKFKNRFFCNFFD